MKFTCQRHPGLYVRDLGVRFTDGVAEVDAATAARLRTLPAELGVRQAGGDEDPGTDAPAKARRTRRT
ncbi:hypothetical protein [Saccharopolyspora spinosa]|uniref:Uncharacterized protein n=1 Tax=Saccharopolyspora spinosa TaxID=60894 RepID=A0A2N3XZ52_SACSN|nr:hypothetical protein [Saccharopolyspora spinosa]PKW15932.1 hypothetical protein A8926_3714 [Saccharopolyspora spinosa]